MSYSLNQTWLSFNLAFVDSHYDTPKKLVSTDDPETWSLSYRLLDPTARINSYSSNPEVNYPGWTLGLKGHGWRIGFLSHENKPGGVNGGGESGNTPQPGLTAANQVLLFGQGAAGTGDYKLDTDGVVKVTKNAASTAYAAYEVPQLYSAAVTVGWNEAVS